MSADSSPGAVLGEGARTVAISAGPAEYPAPPFSPCPVPPEYPFKAVEGPQQNAVYVGVRDSLRLLGLDAGRFGTPEWNPLGNVVQPGDNVVLKPNFVREFRESQPGHGDCLITHGSVIRAVLDYVYIALKGRGRIVIADAPQNDADFEAIRRIVGLDEIQSFYRREVGFAVEVYDLRPERARKIDGVVVGHEPLSGDPAGYVKVNLGRLSMFSEISDLCHLLYGSEYDTNEVRRHHHGDVHEYLVSRTVLNADVVISLPKLKTHKKTGITVNLKNMVGINGNKNWLPHHREGTPSQGGDQYADDALSHRMERIIVQQFKRLFPRLGRLRPVFARSAKAVGKYLFGDTNKGTIRSGNWYGNDTTWRMVLDLNRILLYAEGDGVIHDSPVRRVFCVVDGVVAGEGNGPLDSTPKPSGVVVAGLNPLSVDLACSHLMGFHYQQMPMLRGALVCHALPVGTFSPTGIVIRSNCHRYEGDLQHLVNRALFFTPQSGWMGHLRHSVSVDAERSQPCAV